MTVGADIPVCYYKKYLCLLHECEHQVWSKRNFVDTFAPTLISSNLMSRYVYN